MLTCLQNIKNYPVANKISTDCNYNLLSHEAIERNLITIGEAMDALLRSTPGIE